MSAGRATWGEIRVAWADSATSDLRFGTAPDRLGAHQRRRLAALSGAAAERFIVARELLAVLLAEVAAEPAADHGPAKRDRVELTASCDRCGGEHGALRVHGVPAVVSVSYAGSMVAVAATSSRWATAVGVDIERVAVADPHVPLASLTALFAPVPPPSIHDWTVLEAVLKADGRGVTVDVTQCAIEPSATGRAVRIPGRTDSVPVATLPGPAGFVLSVAAIAPGGRSSTG